MLYNFNKSFRKFNNDSLFRKFKNNSFVSRQLSTSETLNAIKFDNPPALNFFESGLRLLCGIPLSFFGFFSVNKNQVKVITYFGKYYTCKSEGLRFNLPVFREEYTVFTGLQSHIIADSKVVDAEGRPLIMSAMVNYQIIDPVKFTFNIVNPKFITDQINIIIKKIASKYSYDELRKEHDVITTRAKAEAQELVNVAGAHIHTINFTDLNYTPEIAQSMLLVQQAEVSVKAKHAISTAAVEIVKEVLKNLEHLQMDKKSIDQLVVNLVTTIAGQSNPIPVITL